MKNLNNLIYFQHLKRIINPKKNLQNHNLNNTKIILNKNKNYYKKSII